MGNICTPLHVCRLCCDLRDVPMDWRQRPNHYFRSSWCTDGLETEVQSLFQIFLMYRWTGDRGPIFISDLLDVPIDWRQRPNHYFRSWCTDGLETEAQSLFQIFLMYWWTGDRGPIIISDLLDVPMDWRLRPNHYFRSWCTNGLNLFQVLHSWSVISLECAA